MRNSVLFSGLIAIIVCLAYVQSAPAPQSNNNRSPNPNVNLIRQGLIEKLCKRDQQRNGGGSSARTTRAPVVTTSTTTRRSRSSRQGRTTTQAPPALSCNTYNNYTFEQLIAENRKLLRPVNRDRN